jgi:hypothetical protein
MFAAQGPMALPSSFTPASLTGLIAWFKADVGITLNGSQVSAWADQSGNGNNVTQPTTGNQPFFQATGFNGKQTVYFSTATTSVMASGGDAVALINGTPASCFMVGKPVAADCSSFGNAVGFNGNGHAGATTDGLPSGISFLERVSTGATVGGQRNSATESVITVTDSTNIRIGNICDGANNTVYLNNVAGTPVADTNNFTSPGTLILGSVTFDGHTAQWWGGAISEIVLTNTALSSGDRTSLDNYFKAKWGL